MQKLFKISRHYNYESDKEKQKALTEAQTAQIEALGLKEQFDSDGRGFSLSDS